MVILGDITHKTPKQFGSLLQRQTHQTNSVSPMNLTLCLWTVRGILSVDNHVLVNVLGKDVRKRYILP